PIARVLPLLEPAHLDRDFDYVVPPELDDIAQPGVRVRVRFSGRLIDGYLLERLERSAHTGKLVRLERVVSGERVLTPEILKLVTAVAARYAGTRADVLRLAIPPRHAKVETEGTEKPEKPKRASKKAAAAAVTAVDAVVDLDDAELSAIDRPAAADSASVNALPGSADDTAARSAPPDPVPAEATDAEAAGNKATASTAAGPRRAGDDSAGSTVAADFPGWGRYTHGHSFLSALAAGRGPRAGWQALPGEDWAKRLAELAAVTVRGGRGAVIMVPDQRDLDRVLAECIALVGESAVGLAAGLGPSARYRRWLSVLRGQAKVVVGTRSAVFSPVRDLGLIAIWDDGDDTFAEPRSPYPHAREVAMLRAHETGAAFVAAGFARTAEVQAIVESGWAHDLLADRAVVRQAMPRITAPGDTDAALERDPIAQAIRIPAVAFTEARKALKAGGAVLVQVPRRGYIPALSCAKCRTPARCRHCNGPLALPDSAPASRGALRSGREGVAEAQSPACRWCGITEAAFRCGSCGSRALRAVVIGASRTAEELGRAFPGVPVRGSGGSAILNSVPEGAQVVVSTIGAEPPVPGGYAVAMLLDGWALLGRADLRAAEDALRRWMSAAALVRSDGRVIVMADAGLPTVQALVRWDPVWHAGFELDQRVEVRFPPAVRFAAIDGTSDSIAELLGEAKLPGDVEVLGPVPLPPGARKPFSSGDSPAEVERMILRADRSGAAALSRALTAAQAIRSTHRSDAPLRVQIDPIDIG
ncbi:primosomal protein N', partial [Nocardia sp. NPDC059764]|uniref:primosomal protein N' n=1 Tax=Nocardia sp. NPDC059764 TaxID=3346939 RepID=UPI00364918A4